MFDFLKKKNVVKNEDNTLIKIASLLIHAAKIDENYTEKEREIIKKTLIELNLPQNKLDETIKAAEIFEKNSNQLLDFTKEVKNTDNKTKIKVIETLWGIIYSNKEADMYETNLMRRLAGLLYIDNKTMGDIKERVKKKF